MNPFVIVKGEIKQNLLGIIAMILLIAISLAIGVGVSAQKRAVEEGANKAADPFDLIVGAQGSKTDLLFTSVYLRPGSVNLLSGEYLKTLNADQRLKYAAPIGFGDRYGNLPIIGTIAELVLEEGPLVEGRIFEKMNEAVVGYNSPLEIGFSFAPVHGQLEEFDGEHDEHSNSSYVVVGRLPKWNSAWDNAILVPIESLWAVHDLPTGHGDQHGKIGRDWNSSDIPGVPAIAIKPIELKDAYTFRNLFNEKSETMAIFPAEVLLELYTLMGDVASVLTLFSVATQILVIMSVLITILVYLSQRKKALAVLRALGASRSYVFIIVWLQVFIIVFIGCLLGVLIGISASSGVSLVVERLSGLSLESTITSSEIRLALYILISGSLLALIPAFAIYRQPVSQSLRSAL